MPLSLSTLIACVLGVATLVSSSPTTPVHGIAPVSLPQEAFSPLIPQKILATANTLRSPAQYPQFTDRVSGTWQWFSPDTWTTGFFPTTLYALHTRSQLCPGSVGDTDWLALARRWSAAEIPLETKTGVGHDVGFLSFPFSEELLVNPNNATAIMAVNNFAKALAARFNPTVGCTRSWDASDPTDFQVIIDNMMNLEVLFRSADLTGNDALRQIAISHARKTTVNHLRPDGSSFHVVDYNSTTGKVFRQRTSQGFADSSTWTRGQAWGIYGFANMHRNTGMPEFLQTARHMASFFLDHIPANGIVPWDFNAPLNPPRPADTSASMIAATGLILLAQEELKQKPENTTGAAVYIQAAADLFKKTTDLAWNPSWQSLLSNGTVNNPAQNNLTGIVYGDYYYIRTANELVAMGLASC
ncbi:d-4,5 unsaturated-glucuronyl hydrolase-like protein [Cristinia sonorae]|uniref:D-4,5 unsaturated-glucuronyl hydrolase-like protein n=1 Tax=Cristinia sonorae TaxID=1940300 RepID=A0A8K0UQ15_9AGAR|nr:d-4,5 unsaturated-glucuronyl hydrolase-like protein [Cristinia sonorae]